MKPSSSVRSSSHYSSQLRNALDPKRQTMDGASDVGEYKRTDQFEEFNINFDIDVADDKELWLIQWPLNSAPDIDGQTLSLNLHHNGLLGTFEGSTGKQYEVVSNEPPKSGATVFLPSSSDCQIAGKISRHVSIVHYPDPKEISETNLSVFKKMAKRSAASSMTGSASRFSTPTQGMRSRSSGLKSGRTGTVVTGCSGDTSKPFLKRHADNPARSIDQSLEDSIREPDSGAPSGSLEQSQERKSKKKRKSEA